MEYLGAIRCNFYVVLNRIFGGYWLEYVEIIIWKLLDLEFGILMWLSVEIIIELPPEISWKYAENIMGH